MRHVDGQEEVADPQELGISLLVGIGQSPEIGAVLEGGGEYLDHGGQAVSLVSTHQFSQPTDWQKSHIPLVHLFDHTAGVRGRIAVLIDDPALRNGLVCPGRHFDPAARYDGCGSIVHVGKWLIGRRGNGDGIGTQHRHDPKGRRGGWMRVGDAQAHHPLFDSHERVVTGNAIVAGIADGNCPDTILPGSIDRQFHRMVAHHHSHPIPAVDHSRCLGIPDHGPVRLGELQSILNALVIHLQMGNAV